MEGKLTATRAPINNGICAVLGQNAREEMCFLGYVFFGSPHSFENSGARETGSANILRFLGWARFMQWKYPVEVVVTSKATFEGAGVIGAAASL